MERYKCGGTYRRTPHAMVELQYLLKELTGLVQMDSSECGEIMRHSEGSNYSKKEAINS